jgi:hypothetical protein
LTLQLRSRKICALFTEIVHHCRLDSVYFNSYVYKWVVNFTTPANPLCLSSFIALRLCRQI